jgi:hypothetical protein
MAYLHTAQSKKGEIMSKKDLIILQPVAMRVPNCQFVYSPSKLRPKKIISHEEFLARYANHSRKIRVCFDEIPSSNTIFQRSKVVTAYGLDLYGWYIIESSNGRALNGLFAHCTV